MKGIGWKLCSQLLGLSRAQTRRYSLPRSFQKANESYFKYSNDWNVSSRCFSARSGRDYYSVLGASKGDSNDVIKKKYRKLALKYHPDSNKDESSNGKFQEINEAWSVLKDEKARKKYDEIGHEQFVKYKEAGMNPEDQHGFGGQGGFGGFEDLFEHMMGGQRSNRRQGGASRRPQQGSDLQLELEIGFYDAIRGTNRTFSYTREGKCSSCSGSGIENNKKADVSTCEMCHGSGTVQHAMNSSMVFQQTCPRCEGSGQKLKNACGSCHGKGTARENVEVKDMKVPPGVNSGAVLSRPNGGNFGEYKGPAGDLLVHLRVSKYDPQRRFERNHLDLHTNINISMVSSLLGTSVELDNAYQKTLEVKIPTGTKHKSVLRVGGEGVRYGTKKGDLFVQVLLEDLKDLTPRQVELLKEFEAEENKKKAPEDKTQQETTS